MNQAPLFSSGERSILIVIALLMCFTFYKDISNKIIESYNQYVGYEQQCKLYKANHPNDKEQFHYTPYDHCGGGLSLWELIIRLQFITNPILLLLLKRQTLKAFSFSTFLNLLTFLSYFAWAYGSYRSKKINNYFLSETNIGFGDYIFPYSNSLQQFSFVLIAVLLVLQLFILTRFLMEKFNGKISLA